MHNGAIKDVSNWLDKGGTAARLLEIAAETPELSPGQLPAGDVQADEPSGIKYQAFTCAQLAVTEFKSEYVIEGVYEKFAPMVVGAPKKGLKTNTMLDFGVSCATGSPWLGHFRVLQKIRVGMMTAESGMPTIKETLERICCARDMGLAEVEGLIISPDLPKINDPAHIDAVVEFIKEHKLQAFICDPFYLMLGGQADVANMFAQGELLRNIGEAVRSVDCGLVLIHHLRKNIAGDVNQPPDLGDLSHAGVSEYARQWLLWSRRASYQPGSGYHPLWLTVGGSSGHSGLYAVDVNEGAYNPANPRYWQVEVSTAGEARDTAKERRDEEKAARLAKRLESGMAAIVRAMLTEPLKAGATKTKIRDSTSLNTSEFNTAFERLIDTLQIEATEVLVSNHKTPKAGWKITPDTQSEPLGPLRQSTRTE